MAIDCPGHSDSPSLVDVRSSSYDLFLNNAVKIRLIKPFNQFASEMSELSEKLKKLDAKIARAKVKYDCMPKVSPTVF